MIRKRKRFFRAAISYYQKKSQNLRYTSMLKSQSLLRDTFKRENNQGITIEKSEILTTSHKIFCFVLMICVKLSVSFCDLCLFVISIA